MLNKRSHWKIPYLSNIFLRFLKKTNNKRKFKIKTQNRNSFIPSTLLTKTLNIYNGRKYQPIIIKKEMVGHKIGEFGITKILGYKPKKKRKTQVKRKKN